MTNPHTSHSPSSDSRQGAVLPAVLMLLVLLAFITGAFMYNAHTAVRTSKRWKESDQCLLAIQSTLEEVKYAVYQSFETNFNNRARQWRSIAWFSNSTATTVGDTSAFVTKSEYNYYGATVKVAIARSTSTSFESMTNALYGEVTVYATGTLNGLERSICEVFRIGLQRAPIFDYAYFINNWGWFYGATITSHGDVRANGNFSMRYGPTVNGDTYAAVNPAYGAAGNNSGTRNNWNTTKYHSDAPNAARPTNPTDPSDPGGTSWNMGYDPNTTDYSYYQSLDMPYLADLSDYEWYSSNLNGTVVQDGVTIVSNIYNGPGPDGTNGTPDDGTLILDGTSNTLTVTGPVVVKGDVIIKGKVTGKGCIYAGRNVHIAGNVIAQNPPSWSKPDSNPEQTKVLNENKDMVGLAAKGNVILGNYASPNYNWYDRVKNWADVGDYEIEPSDADIGYATYTNSDGKVYFDGDYRALDGGTRFQDDGSIATNRRFYECCLSYSNFNDFADQDLNRIDAVLYNNHAQMGYVGITDNFVVNGSMVGRDDVISFDKGVILNWDIRLGSRSPEGIDTFFLPLTLAEPVTRQWREVP